MKNKIKKSWRVIYSILQETGYDKLYEEDITTIVNFIKENLDKVKE